MVACTTGQAAAVDNSSIFPPLSYKLRTSVTAADFGSPELYTLRLLRRIVTAVGTLIESRIPLQLFHFCPAICLSFRFLPSGLNVRPLSLDLESKNAGLMCPIHRRIKWATSCMLET